MGCLYGSGINSEKPIDLSESCQRAAKLSCQGETLATAYEHHWGRVSVLLLLHSLSYHLLCHFSFCLFVCVSMRLSKSYKSKFH